MMPKKKSDGWQQLKAITIEKYFNCGKKKYYIKNCRLVTKSKLKDEKAI